MKINVPQCSSVFLTNKSEAVSDTKWAATNNFHSLTDKSDAVTNKIEALTDKSDYSESMSDDTEAIVERLNRLETEDHAVEVKAGTKIDSAFWESVSAFANTDGGLIILGLEEVNGKFSPAPKFEVRKVESQLISMLAENPQHESKVKPIPRTQMKVDEVEGSPVITVQVEAMRSDPRLAKQMPCYMTQRGVKDGSYKRTLSGDKKLSAYEIYELTTLFDEDLSDLDEVQGAGGSDLDRAAIEELMDQLHAEGSRVLYGTSNTDEALKRLNILGESSAPTMAGLLVFGNYPQQFFPQLFIDVTVHPGVEKSTESTRFIARRRCDGPLPLAIDDAVRTVLANLRTRSVERGAELVQEPEIPEIVIREAVLNAVMHRDYSPQVRGRQVAVDVFPDRVEVNNPGGLWGDRTIDNLTDNRSVSRNSALASLLSLAPNASGKGRVAENQGSGINRMLYGMTQQGLPEPSFNSEIGEFTVILFRFGLLTPETSEWVNHYAPTYSRPAQIALVLAKELGAVTIQDLKKHLGKDSDELRVILSDLEKNQLLHKLGDRYVLGTKSLGIEASDQVVLDALSSSEPKSIHEIAELTGQSLATLRLRLRELIEVGLVQPTAPPTSRNRKYVLA